MTILMDSFLDTLQKKEIKILYMKLAKKTMNY